MTFDKIIKEAGFEPCKFPKASLISTTVYDGKDREIHEELTYSKELFVDNINSASKFFSFLNFLEAKPVLSMNVKIDADYVVVFYNTPQVIYFRRTPTMDPLDYMV